MGRGSDLFHLASDTLSILGLGKSGSQSQWLQRFVITLLASSPITASEIRLRILLEQEINGKPFDFPSLDMCVGY